MRAEPPVQTVQSSGLQLLVQLVQPELPAEPQRTRLQSRPERRPELLPGPSRRKQRLQQRQRQLRRHLHQRRLPELRPERQERPGHPERWRSA